MPTTSEWIDRLKSSTSDETLRIFSIIPRDERTEEVCLTAVQQNADALGDIDPDKQTETVCLAGVKQDGLVLRFIDPEKQTEAIYLAAVEQVGIALRFIDPEKLTEAVCLAAVKQNARVLRYIKPEKQTEAVWMATAKKNVEVLKDIDPTQQTEAMHLTFVKQNGRALKFIPPKNQTEAVRLAAVKQNGLVLKLIDPEQRTGKICLAAVRENANAMDYVPNEHRESVWIDRLERSNSREALEIFLEISPNEITEKVCLSVVKQNSNALRYFPDHHREAIIESLSPAYLLAADYACIRYFPNREKYEDEIDAFLSKIEYVVVRKNRPDDEIRDIQTVYAKKHPGITVCMSIEDEKDKQDKKELDNLLTTLQNNRNPIHLALTGHAYPTATELAGMTVTDIVNACEKHPNITHIHLLSCRTAQALPPQQEKEMSQSLAAKIRKKEQKKYGFQTMLHAPMNDAEFEKKCADFCEKNKLDGVYVVSKEGNDTYRLIAMKISNDGKMVEKISDIPENRREAVTTVLKMKKPLVFQKDIMTYRDQQSPMQPNEVTAVRALAYEYDRFDPRHPKYKTDKETYPFLAKIPAAITDLQESLLKKLADKIEDNLDIKHEITIEGFTHSLHVDTQTQQLLASRTYLYPSEGYTSALFRQGKSIINRKKLNQERREDINATKKENSELDGSSKARTLLVKTRRKG